MAKPLTPVDPSILALKQASLARMLQQAKVLQEQGALTPHRSAGGSPPAAKGLRVPPQQPGCVDDAHRPVTKR